MGDFILGKVGAINLKSIDLNKEVELTNFIKSIEKIKDKECNRVFIEGYENLEKNTLDRFKEELNLFTENGEFLQLLNLSLVIKTFFDILREDLRAKEVLILCNNKEKAKVIIKELAKEVKFITIYGLNEEEGEELYEYILDGIGLSIFHTKNFYNIIGNYSVIINVLDRMNFKKTIAKKTSIIFDFTSNTGGPHWIRDYGYDFKDMGVRNTKWFTSIVSSQILEFILENNIGTIKPKYIITKDNNYYTFKEYIDLFVKVRGCF